MNRHWRRPKHVVNRTHLSVRLDEAVAEALSLRAAREMRNVSQMVEVLLRLALEDEIRELSPVKAVGT